MTRKPVPRDEWPDFFDAFGRQHAGWLADAWSERADDAEPVVLAREARLRDAELEDADGLAVRFHVDETGRGRSLLVARPVTVNFERDERGAHAGLELTAEDGTRFELRFRAAAMPEELDGLA